MKNFINITGTLPNTNDISKVKWTYYPAKNETFI